MMLSVELLVVLLLCSIYTAGSNSAIRFTFLPLNYIEIGQSAPYYCSVNDTRVGISWLINGSSILPRNINVSGVATPSSSLTIPGLPQYNNTIVRCAAFGYIDNDVPYNNFSESVLRIQGTYI